MHARMQFKIYEGFSLYYRLLPVHLPVSGGMEGVVDDFGQCWQSAVRQLCKLPH